MPQTIREYAHELFEESGEVDAVRGRHAEHYLALAELGYTERFDLGRSWHGASSQRTTICVLRSTIFRSTTPLEYLQLAGALGGFWDATLQFAEGAQRLEDALASARDEGPLHGPGTGAPRCPRRDSGTVLGRAESTGRGDPALARHRGRERLLEALNELGRALYQAGEKPRALEVYEQNLEFARSLGDDALLRQSLDGVCQLLLATGEFERAEPLAGSSKTITSSPTALSTGATTPSPSSTG